MPHFGNNRNRRRRDAAEETNLTSLSTVFDVFSWLSAMFIMYLVSVKFLAYVILLTKASISTYADIPLNQPIVHLNNDSCVAPIRFNLTSGKMLTNIVRLPANVCHQVYNGSQNRQPIAYAYWNHDVVLYGQPLANAEALQRMSQLMDAPIMYSILVGAWCSFMSWMILCVQAW